MKEFEELTSDEVTSLWDSKVNFNSLVETNLVFKGDHAKIKKIVLQEACLAMMTTGLEIAAISKMVELEMNGFDGISSAKLLEDKEKENANLKATLKLVEKTNKVNEKKATNIALELLNLKKKLEEDEASLKKKDEEAIKLKEDDTHLASEIENLRSSKPTLASESSKLKGSILNQLEAGFAKAKRENYFPQSERTNQV